MTRSLDPSHPRPFRPGRPIVIGLLGGIAAGKSTIARLLAERGLAVLDADHEARRVSAEPDVIASVRSRFGPGAIGPDGALDRAHLAAIVFADAGARRDLEAIIHPRVRAALLAQIETTRASGRSVVLDVPLLLENGLIEHCDVCVFVASSLAARTARAASRGWDEGEIARREANQASLAVKKARCAHIIDNDGALEHTTGQVDALLRTLESA